MSYLIKAADLISDEKFRDRLKRVLDKAIPDLKILPASLSHHRKSGGAHEFACKVVKASLDLYGLLKSNLPSGESIGFTQDDVLFVSLISCLDIPSRYRRGEVIGTEMPSGEPLYSFESLNDWGVEPAFYISDRLAQEGIYVSPEVFHALSFREGSFAKNQSKMSPHDMSAMACLLHSAFLLSMSFRQSDPNSPPKGTSIL
jgi:hypothetical protein